MANQYTLDNDFSAIVETQGTLYNPSSSNIELASAADTVKGKGILLMTGERRTFNGTLYARSMDSAATLNVADFTNGSGGGGGSYVLPVASDVTLGGIKVGAGLAIDPDGVLSASGSGGLLPRIVVTAPTGSTVTATNGGTTITAEEVTGTWTFDIPNYGDWNIKCANGTYYNIDTINIDSVKLYYHTMTYYRVVTVNIDLTDSDPTTCCSYADDSVYLSAGDSEWDNFFGHYPVMFKDGVEGEKLDPNDFSLHTDGTAADITSGAEGDVMIAFPQRGLKISTSGDGNTVSVSMTDEPNATGFSYYAHSRGSTLKNKFYIGAYKGYEDSGKLRSLSGKTPTANKTIGAFRTAAQANGAPSGSGASGYDQSAFYQLVYRQAMFLLKYKTTNSDLIGLGYTNGHSAPTVTGGTDAKGMDYGDAAGDEQIKLFGIEDFFGNLWEFVDGFRVVDSGTTMYAGTEGFNDNITGYTSIGNTTVQTDAYMTKPFGTDAAGFIPKAASDGSDSTYFCDKAQAVEGHLAWYGGSYGSNYDASDKKAGIFAFIGNVIASTVSTSGGSRLMYV